MWRHCIVRLKEMYSRSYLRTRVIPRSLTWHAARTGVTSLLYVFLEHAARVSDELKKHYLTDTEGTQYTTNLDRNRYGADNQYMFTGMTCHISCGIWNGLCSYSSQFVDPGTVSLSGGCGGSRSEEQRNDHGFCRHRRLHLRNCMPE